MFLQNQYLAMKICDIFNSSVRNKLTDKKNLIKGAEFATTSTIYLKDLVIEADPKKKINKKKYENDDYVNNKENIPYAIEKNVDNDKKEKKVFKEDLKNLLNNKEKNKNLDKLSNGVSSLVNNNNNCINSNSSKTIESTSTSNSICNLTNDIIINCEKIEKKLERNNSDYSNSSEMTISTDHSKEKKKTSIFMKKEKSRFSFPSDDEIKEEEASLVPGYISNVISFKTSTYFFLKNIEVDEYINKKYKINIEDWHKLVSKTS